ncbi:GNAT family N-acetyltransferase [Nocardioides perillae]|uniref:N-acetyltransferase domain-containing protein n=1 Tax=Nocardioides perillae TaxID=1119534 RepID=A0A7Y9RT32_9ACTN|nr:hypothetical protein [Nocardioides perillae]
MGRTVERLTVDHLALLPGPCGDCLFWELDPVRRARVGATEVADEKAAWLSWVLREWGSCGRVVRVDGEVVAWAVYAPPAFVPGAEAFPTAPVSPDAVLLTTAYVRPGARGGLGRVLVQAVARDLVTRGGVRAVEAFARGPGAAGRVGGVTSTACLLPADFLSSVGFGTHRPHASVPRMRMDLRTALRWRDEVEAAVERLRGAVVPPHAPRPTRATRVGRVVRVGRLGRRPRRDVGVSR